MRWRCAIALSAAALLCAAGCTTSAPRTPLEPVTFRVPFVPAHGEARVRLEAGRYPNLFEPASRVIWLNPPAPPVEQEEPPVIITDEGEVLPAPPKPSGPPPGAITPPELLAQLDPNFYVLECHLESAFPDMSIAYDVVGLRGLHVYLKGPDGAETPPAQVMLGRELEERPRGAIRVYGRTNLLLFPKSMPLSIPIGGGAEPVYRLVLEGHDSTFAFAWAGDLSFVETPPGVQLRRAGQRANAAYWKTHERTRDFLHNFD